MMLEEVEHETYSVPLLFDLAIGYTVANERRSPDENRVMNSIRL